MLQDPSNGRLETSQSAILLGTVRARSVGDRSFRHPACEISPSKAVFAARLRVTTSRRAAMNDDFTREPGPLGGMLCVFLALVVLLIV
jgi:hypothetical protein